MASVFVLGVLLIKGHMIQSAQNAREAAQAEFEGPSPIFEPEEDPKPSVAQQWSWVEKWTPSAASVQASLGGQVKQGQTIYLFSSGTLVMLDKTDKGGRSGAIDILKNTKMSLSDLMVKPTPDGDFLIRYGPKTFFLLEAKLAEQYTEMVNTNWEQTLSAEAQEARKGKPSPPFGVRCALISLYLLEKDRKEPRIILVLEGDKQ